jgi:hypothetical protein
LVTIDKVPNIAYALGIRWEAERMENIYCTACKDKVTLQHADATFACSCEGPINPLDGGDPIPDAWEMPGEDADSVYYELRKVAAAEKAHQEAE